MSATLVNLIIQLISGAVGSGVLARLVSQLNLGPHESPHFCATLKSPSLGFPRAAGWRIIREGELCARRRNDLIWFMTS